MQHQNLGISGFSSYFPPYRVQLQSWCEWTLADWDKTRNVVGNSFRMVGEKENVYTMSANAVIKLIEQYDIDPATITFLALGTESSNDNSAGAIVVKGMVDEALMSMGKNPIARNCEVPEFKHACLGSVYAIKSALRYLALDGADSKAIVVSADIAQYARGSTGEPTQGAGAVAMLLEENPKLLCLDLYQSGSSSAYRCVDFRKPMARFSGQSPQPNGHLKDMPLFNGKYSTTCYLDATIQAFSHMFTKLETEPSQYLRDLDSVFMHRPYQNMPMKGWALTYLFSLTKSNSQDLAELESYCQTGDVELEKVMEELESQPNLMTLVNEDKLDEDIYPNALKALNVFRKSPKYNDMINKKLALGSSATKDMGNLYTAALPAWIAAGLEEALEKEIELSGKPMLAVGYGSGDAAEVIPMNVVDDWQSAAQQIGLKDSMTEAMDLDQTQYETLHDTGRTPNDYEPPANGFEVKSIGSREQDQDIEYYQYKSRSGD